MIKCTFASIIGKDYCFDEWIKTIKKIRMPKEDMMLLWVVNQNMDNEKVREKFNALSKGFQESKIIVSPFRYYTHVYESSSESGFHHKRWGVAFNMNLVNQYRKGDLFVIEDDIFAPPTAYERLSVLARVDNVGIATALGGSHKKMAVDPTRARTAWIFIKQRMLPFEEIVRIRKTIPDFDFYDYQIHTLSSGEGVEDIHAAGTVCTYINECVLKDYIFKGESNLFTGQDVNLGFHATQELKLRCLADWDLEIKHWNMDEQDNIKIV